jgi:2-oxoglutarate dehydrogenase complex dehydrogenase (E1) component-like enzyme
MYKIINQRQSVPNLYKEKIVNQEKLIDEKTVENEVNEFRSTLDNGLEKVNKGTHVIEPRNTYLQKKWSHMSLPNPNCVTSWATGCDTSFLKFIGTRSVTYPENFVSNFFFKYLYI